MIAHPTLRTILPLLPTRRRTTSCGWRWKPSLAYQGRRVAISRDDLIAKPDAVSIDKTVIAFIIPDLITVLKKAGIQSDPPGRVVKAHTVRIKPPRQSSTDRASDTR